MPQLNLDSHLSSHVIVGKSLLSEPPFPHLHVRLLRMRCGSPLATMPSTCEPQDLAALHRCCLSLHEQHTEAGLEPVSSGYQSPCFLHYEKEHSQALHRLKKRKEEKLGGESHVPGTAGICPMGRTPLSGGSSVSLAVGTSLGCYTDHMEEHMETWGSPLLGVSRTSPGTPLECKTMRCGHEAGTERILSPELKQDPWLSSLPLCMKSSGRHHALWPVGGKFLTQSVLRRPQFSL